MQFVISFLAQQSIGIAVDITSINYIIACSTIKIDDWYWRQTCTSEQGIIAISSG